MPGRCAADRTWCSECAGTRACAHHHAKVLAGDFPGRHPFDRTILLRVLSRCATATRMSRSVPRMPAAASARCRSAPAAVPRSTPEIRRSHHRRERQSTAGPRPRARLRRLLGPSAARRAVVNRRRRPVDNSSPAGGGERGALGRRSSSFASPGSASDRSRSNPSARCLPLFAIVYVRMAMASASSAAGALLWCGFAGKHPGDVGLQGKGDDLV